mmetsp:Transcript_27044/g.37748  ORF Transcript_27044/g.37748 Transcript_27044/m.37748 type:complete len:351 (+) Transcript_27044:93-1145(+)
MTDLPVLRGYERWLKRNARWFIPALENMRTLSICYTPYSSDYHKNEEYYVAFEAVADVVGVYHDAILDRYGQNDLKIKNDTAAVRFVKKVLSVTEKIQLLVEILAMRRTKDKWRYIVAIEAIKLVLRLYLLHKNEGRPLCTFTPEELRKMNDRSKSMEIAHQNFPELSSKSGIRDEEDFSDLILMYARHGRGVDPHGDFLVKKSAQSDSSKPTQMEIVSEIFYLVRPLIYSGLRCTTNSRDFTPWVASLTTDLISLLLKKLAAMEKENVMTTTAAVKKKKNMNSANSSRAFMLLLYLLRAPFYQKYTKNKLMFLVALIKHIPLLGSGLLGPILEITFELFERRYFATSAS